MIGENIKEIRIRKQITLTMLSKKTGLNLGHLSHIEKGRRTPSLKSLESIAQALDVEVQDLFHPNNMQLISYNNMKEEGENYNHRHDKGLKTLIPLVEKIEECVLSSLDADFVLKIKDESLEPFFHKNTQVIVKKCSKLENGDIGLFWKDGKLSCSLEKPQQDELHFLGKVVQREEG